MILLHSKYSQGAVKSHLDHMLKLFHFFYISDEGNYCYKKFIVKRWKEEEERQTERKNGSFLSYQPHCARWIKFWRLFIFSELIELKKSHTHTFRSRVVNFFHLSIIKFSFDFHWSYHICVWLIISQYILLYFSLNKKIHLNVFGRER